MVEIICLVFLSLAIIILCLFLFFDGKISKAMGKATLLFLASLFVIFSLIFKPNEFIRWDLIQHFQLVDNMRAGGFNYATQESQYADLYVYNYFAYFISLLPKQCQNLLTAIPLTIDFAIVGYIYKESFNEYLPDTSGKTRILSIALWLFTFGIKLAISGIRCSLAVSIAVLAIYMELIQKKNKYCSILLYIIAIFVHNFALVVILARLLTAIKKPILIMISSFTISLLLEPISRFIVARVSNEYLSFSFKRILETVTDMNFISALQSFNGVTLIIYMCFIALSVYLFVISTKLKQQYTKDGYCNRVANFAATVGALAIGLSFNYLYLERFMYLMSFALLMITPLHNRSKNSINVENLFLLPMTLFLFFFNDIYLFMVNYVGNYFLSF